MQVCRVSSGRFVAGSVETSRGGQARVGFAWEWVRPTGALERGWKGPKQMGGVDPRRQIVPRIEIAPAPVAPEPAAAVAAAAAATPPLNPQSSGVSNAGMEMYACDG